MAFPPSEPRKRGAQPGNQNARKHGFYSSRLLPAEENDLAEFEAIDMSGEIDLIRTQLRRLLEDAASQPATFDQRIELIRVICVAVRSLNRLIRTQHNIYPQTNNILELRRMADEIRQDVERAARARDPNYPSRFSDPDPRDPNGLNDLLDPALIDPLDVQDW